MSNLIKIVPTITATNEAVKKAFKPYADAMATNTKTAQGIIDTYESLETDEERIELSKTARKCLSAIVSQRTGMDEKRAEIKAPFLKAGREIDSEAKSLRLFSKEVEDALTPIAKYEKVMKEKALQALRNDRADQIAIMGADEFVIDGTDLAAFTPEQWDAQLGNYQTLVDARNAKEVAEAKAQEEAKALEAKRVVLRDARGKMLASVGYFHPSDLADLNEVEFMQVLAKAQEAKADADDKAKADAQAARLQAIEDAKAQAEAQAKAKEQAKADAEADKLRKLQEGSDGDKLLSMASKLEGIDAYISSFDMSSDRGNEAQGYARKKVDELKQALRELAGKLK